MLFGTLQDHNCYSYREDNGPGDLISYTIQNERRLQYTFSLRQLSHDIQRFLLIVPGTTRNSRSGLFPRFSKDSGTLPFTKVLSIATGLPIFWIVAGPLFAAIACSFAIRVSASTTWIFAG